ncbi:CoA-transferase family III [Xylariaceae sp. FL0255]|nr:CoA-transferase family III [Xylariaceae sp. FL0255]
MPTPSCKDRSNFTPFDIVEEIWRSLDLPPKALSSLSLPGTDNYGGTTGQIGPVVPSSFKVGHLAQASIALSALGAALVCAERDRSRELLGEEGKRDVESGLLKMPKTTVPLRSAILEFHAERLYTLSDRPPVSIWGPIGGLHPTSDGFVKIHDNFEHHRRGVLELLGLDPGCEDRESVSDATRKWDSKELERVAVEERGLCVYALRSFEEWDRVAEDWGRDRKGGPVRIRRVESDSESRARPTPPNLRASSFPPDKIQKTYLPTRRCLNGLRVVELSRVIAAPCAGKTLTAHGSDTLWVTSPNLPDLPALDVEFSRGKRERLMSLIKGADVFIQSYRPGTLTGSKFGLGPERLAGIRPGIVVGNLSAFADRGSGKGENESLRNGAGVSDWSKRRGFDSLIQTCTGLNVAEAQAAGEGKSARPLPCQALDHAAGFFLAFGICAAVYLQKRDLAEERRIGEHRKVAGAYVVDVSLEGIADYLKSLGQFPGRSGFEGMNWGTIEDREEENGAVNEYFGKGMTPWGEMRFVKHAASIEGFEVSWERMPGKLGKDEAIWLER